MPLLHGQNASVFGLTGRELQTRSPATVCEIGGCGSLCGSLSWARERRTTPPQKKEEEIKREKEKKKDTGNGNEEQEKEEEKDKRKRQRETEQKINKQGNNR